MCRVISFINPMKMDDLWKFQPENELKVQQLLNEIAKNPKPESKWKDFLMQSDIFCTSIKIGSLDSMEPQSNTQNDIVNVVAENESQEPIQEEDLRILRELLENDLKKNVNSIAEMCTKKAALWEYLADSLCDQNVEIFIKFFSREHSTDKDTIRSFYKDFFALLLAKKYSRFMLEAVLEIHRNNFGDFSNHLLPVMYNRREVSPDVLQDFCNSISDAHKREILETLSNLEHDVEVVSKHLLTLLMLYKTCDKSDKVQDYVLDIVLTYGGVLKNDKNFGKLLLIHVQNLKQYPKRYSAIENIIMEHESIFKRPCLMALTNVQKIK